MEGGGRQYVSFKYTDSIQRPGARAQGLGKMVTNTEVSAQDKAQDGKDLNTRDPGLLGAVHKVCHAIFGQFLPPPPFPIRSPSRDPPQRMVHNPAPPPPISRRPGTKNLDKSSLV